MAGAFLIGYSEGGKMSQDKEVMTLERLDHYVEEAVKAAGYEEGFGIRGCDLSLTKWWVAYARQSLKEQAENDRLGEYLFTCARLAKQAGVIVPREYVIYDADSSEDFNRRGMIRLRGELMAKRRISGVIIPSQGRLSMDPHHQLTFEKECDYYGVQVIYGDAPGGKDWASQTARLIQAQANALRVKSNRDNALGGNIARVLAGKAPSHRAPYGYTYRAEKIIEPRTGRARVLRAWWEINEIGTDEEPLWGSPAWVVRQIFIWIGDECRTAYWVANRLNELKITPPARILWAPKTVIKIVNRRCYTGRAEYNANGRVPNPNRPLGDLTLGIKRTLLRPKPEAERVAFAVPPLTTEELWKRAKQNITERGRGRGKQGKIIQALFRTRMFCPRCENPMSVLRDKRGQVFYYCRAHYCHWVKDPCRYNRFVPGTWDDEIWDEIGVMLKDDTWIERQLAEEFRQDEGLDKLIRLQQLKIKQAEDKIRKVEEGFDGGLYSLEEARKKKVDYQGIIEKARQEISCLQAQVQAQGFTRGNVDALRQELNALRERNLKEAAFEERVDLVAMLGIKVYPSEDLKSRRIACRLNLTKVAGEREQNDFAKVTFGGPVGIRTGSDKRKLSSKSSTLYHVRLSSRDSNQLDEGEFYPENSIY
jgi:hypothetical protein